MRTILLVMGISVAIAVYFIVTAPKCLQSHEEPRHQHSYTTFIYVGKMMVPQFHPAYDYQTTVCDEYEHK